MAPRRKAFEQHRILRPVAERDGQPVFVWDRVAETLRLGAFLDDAASRCGLTKDLLQQWVREGVRLRSSMQVGVRLPQTLTEEEQAMVRVATAVDQAEADGKVFLLGLLERVSRGAEVRVVTEKVDPASGVVTERTTRTEYLAPDPATLRWRLERRWPDEYGRRTVEVVGRGGGPIEVASTEERARELAESLRKTVADRATNGATNGNGSHR